MRIFFLICYLIVTLLMIGLILLQKSEAGMGLGSGSTGGLLTSRGAANLLTRMTGILAAVFMAMSLFLAYLAKREASASKLITTHLVKTLHKKKDLTKDQAAASETVQKDGTAKKPGLKSFSSRKSAGSSSSKRFGNFSEKKKRAASKPRSDLKPKAS